MISRRDALKLSAAVMNLPAMMSRLQSAVALQSDSGVWNWMGNAGHTREMPGPGLDYSGPTGELWRIPTRTNWHLAGLLNRTLFVVDSFPNMPRDRVGIWRITAINCDDGSLLWSRNAPGFEQLGAEGPDPEWSQETVSISWQIGIVGTMVLLTLSDGRLWAVDASTGAPLWEFDSGYDRIGAPTVIGSIGILARNGGVLALSLADSPKIVWDVDVEGHNFSLLGLDEELVWIAADGYISVLDVHSGTEYWRISSGDFFPISAWLGLVDGTGTVEDRSMDQFSAIDHAGTVVWTADDSDFDTFRAWIVRNKLARATEPVSADDFQSCQLQCLSIEDGSELWWFKIDAGRWWLENDNYDVTMCDGIAYALIRDKFASETVLVLVDPDEMSVRGARGLNLDPRLVTGGFLIAIDTETDEIVCVGTVSGVLRPGGRARVKEDTTIYGAPNTASIVRGTVPEGDVLAITVDIEVTSYGDWVNVLIPDSSVTGWLRADVLTGLDGDIVFESMDLSEFGQFAT